MNLLSDPVGVSHYLVVGAILFTLFLIWVGGRVFRVAILLQGTPPKLKNFVRWAVRG